MMIAHNLVAANAQRHFKLNTNRKTKSTEKLSSGYRINRSADDAAGLTISEKMRQQIRGLNKGAQNIQDGISLIQVADGALSEVNDILHRISELSIQSANDTNTYSDRCALQNEVSSLIKEIDRIGMDTTFNSMHLFDDDTELHNVGPVTQLVSSPGADSGYLTEALKIGSYYYPSASLDFSKINRSNLSQLDGASFSFNCSDNCAEVFHVTFTTDGTPSSAKNLKGAVTHYYSVDISKAKNGTDVVNSIYDYVSNNLPSSATGSSIGGVKVSHSNNLMKSSDGTKLYIVANVSRYSSEAAAKSAYPKASLPKSGAITYTELYKRNDAPKTFYNIQCSSNPSDSLEITASRMNSTYIGVSGINISSAEGAAKGITACAKATETISAQRSEWGAYQNRLEHALDNVNNTSENTSAAESRLRDADMASIMVDYSKSDILSQIGQALIAQANQNSSAVLSLLNS